MLARLPITIKLLTPVVLSEKSGDLVLTGTREYFSGSVIRGALAGAYLKQQKLEAAEQDQDFYQAFLSGSFQYLPAYPQLGQNLRSVPLSLSLQRSKVGDKIVDLADINVKPAAGYKSFRGLAVVQGKELTLVSVKKSIELHMSRSGAKERIVGSSQDGGIYNYEAMAAGQEFGGYIQGAEEDLQWLLHLLEAKAGFAEGNHSLYFGRSKYTQYGKCSLTMGKIAPVATWPKVEDKSLYLHCLTDYLPENSLFGTAREALAELLPVLGLPQVELGRIFAQPVELDSFVGVWGVKRPRVRGLKAGTILELCKTDGSAWSEAETAQMQAAVEGGVGRRTEEGFGQLGLWQPQAWQLKKITAVAVKKPEAGLAPEVVRAARLIIWQEIDERLRNLAQRDVKSYAKVIAGKVHLFARLENVIETCKGDQSAVAEKLSDSSTALKNLQKMKLGSYNLYEILSGSAHGINNPEELLPYGGANWDNLIRTRELAALAGELGLALDYKELNKDGKVFKQYWTWFCRYARKNKGGEQQ